MERSDLLDVLMKHLFEAESAARKLEGFDLLQRLPLDNRLDDHRVDVGRKLRHDARELTLAVDGACHVAVWSARPADPRACQGVLIAGLRVGSKREHRKPLRLCEVSANAQYCEVVEHQWVPLSFPVTMAFLLVTSKSVSAQTRASIRSGE